MNHYFDLNCRLKDSSVAFGYFDGLHSGHRKVIEKLAKFNNSVVVSFAEDEKPVLTTESEKEFILQKLGIKTMVSIKASQYENMMLSDFIRLLIDNLGAKTLVCGSCFANLEELKEICRANSIDLEVADAVFYDSQILTSRIIADRMAFEDMNRTIALLGGSYVISGMVVRGKGQGREHRMPTANLSLPHNKILPKFGVYGTLVNIGSGRYRGMTNVGPRPSADNDPTPTCETLIENFDGVLYNIPLTIESYYYVRPVLKFQNLDDVRRQIEKDKLEAEEFLEGYSPCKNN